MMRFGSLIATVFGIAGFIGLGLWGSFQCQVFGIGGRLNCGWVFILMAPIGFVVGGLLFQLIKALVRVFCGAGREADAETARFQKFAGWLTPSWAVLFRIT